MMETITVEGRGCVHVVPDVTRLDIKVKGLFKNYKVAYERAQQNSSMLVQVLGIQPPERQDGKDHPFRHQ